MPPICLAVHRERGVQEVGKLGLLHGSDGLRTVEIFVNAFRVAVTYVVTDIPARHVAVQLGLAAALVLEQAPVIALRRRQVAGVAPLEQSESVQTVIATMVSGNNLSKDLRAVQRELSCQVTSVDVIRRRTAGNIHRANVEQVLHNKVLAAEQATKYAAHEQGVRLGEITLYFDITFNPDTSGFTRHDAIATNATHCNGALHRESLPRSELEGNRVLFYHPDFFKGNIQHTVVVRKRADDAAHAD